MVKYRYDAWGKFKILDADGNEITDETHIGYLNPFRYRGYYYSDDLGLYYLKSRFYDPEVGRFISADSIDYLAPDIINGLNLYAYCGNNPVMNVDPSGHAWWEWVIASVLVAACIVGAVFTGGTSLLGAALIGAAIGGGISIASQAASVAKNGGDFNWGQFAFDFGMGAISGMLGASSISRAVSTVCGGILGGASSLGSQLLSGTSIQNVNWWKVGAGVLIGGAASFLAGAGMQNTEALNSAPAVEKAIASVNKVLTRQHTGYYSSARYAQAALTNVSNRLGIAVAKEQVKSIVKALSLSGAGSFSYNTLTFFWR